MFYTPYRKLTTSGFLCPQCQAKYCELPVECKACGLTLVSAPHLGESYESFDRKRALVKYQSQNEVIKVIKFHT